MSMHRIGNRTSDVNIGQGIKCLVCRCLAAYDERVTTRKVAPDEPVDEASWSDDLAGIRPVRKAHEQIYDQLRSMILSGGLAQGHRFPSEPQLAERFGVSRTTVRSALQLLVSDGLVHTRNGAGGGTFVTLPSVNRVSDYLMRSVELLSQTDDVTLAEFLEARELLEVFALRRLTALHTSADIEKLRSTISPSGGGNGPGMGGTPERSFHQLLIDLCPNTLVQIAAQPIHFVLESRLSNSSSRIATNAREQCRNQHAEILDAIVSGDSATAEDRMRSHLRDLASVYEEIWVSGRTP